MPTISNNEILNIERYIKSNDVVFDVGACVGEWTNEVLQCHEDVVIHQFEPSPFSFEVLKTTNAIHNKLALSNRIGQTCFYYYPSEPRLSTEFRRSSELEMLHSLKPNEIVIDVTTIDEYCKERGILKINFLKIDVEGNELFVLEGAKDMLNEGRIDYVQFEYGACFYDAGISFQQIWELLNSHGFKVYDESSVEILHWRDFKTNMYVITGDCLAIKE